MNAAVMIIGDPPPTPAPAPAAFVHPSAPPPPPPPAGEAASAYASPAADPAAAGASPAAGRTITNKGRLREGSVPDSERTYTTLMHLSPLTFMWVGPLALAIPFIMWLMRKDRSVFTDDHGREIANFAITWVVLSVAFVWTVVVPVVLSIVAIVNIIRGAVAASRNEYFRYPITIRFL